MRDLYTRPANYIAPSNIADFMQRYQSGERYFEGARLAATSLFHSEHQGINFRHANLAGAELKEATFQRCDFSHTDCRQTSFDHSRLTNCSFAHADLSGASLYHTGFWFVNFLATNLGDALYTDTQHWRGPHGVQLRQSGKFMSCFISYANRDLHNDEGLVSTVSEALIHAGVPHWMQPYSSWLAPGVELGSYFLREIANCDVFVLLLTQHVTRSHPIELEVSAALSLQEGKGAPAIVVLRDEAVALPQRAPWSALGDAESLDCASGEEVNASNKLIAWLRSHAG